jgi:phenylacetate-CoA ligase
MRFMSSAYEIFFRNVVFPAYETLIRRNTHRYRREYERSQWLPREALIALQLGKLNDLLAHAWRHVPYLQSKWKAHGLDPSPLKSVADLASYPILTKEEITANYGDMIAKPWRGRTLSKVTGGSTGDPFRLEYTMDSYARRIAVMWRGYSWGRADLGARTAYLWGTGLRQGGWGGVKDRLYHSAFNRRFLDAFSMREDNVEEYVRQIEQYRPNAVVGYVAPVVQVARHMNSGNKRFSGIRAVLTGAEALYPPERAEIERAFGCPVFNTYGCREFMLLASECDRHSGLHVNVDHLVVETVDEEARPIAGASGDVAVTDLHNYAMPFVRFKNGDSATLCDQQCECGRGLPLLASVDGRILDVIVTPDGRSVPGEYFVYVMLDWQNIRQYQAVQTAPNVLEFRVVARSPLSAEQRDRLAQRLRSKLGPSMNIDIRETHAIPTTASGKRRISISLANAHTAPALDSQ